ncbi:ABC transporter ATP-binding protein [Aquibacillus albus]|uniref:ABC-2 type transport system ATP-binding protein n=1 Tax=Aquibacillus albus TaxID=1168171 RepID=A0ABS2N507_9BACI|nr:ABC transporter ATP-binding protein [Aquibacillus albus]MBM7573208.1 ABC-2 type transport system ATP-binding protein [Aquibacillus albus]
MISFSNVTKTFDAGKVSEHVLHDVTFEIRRGSIYGLLGSNGAGKTTLLKILAGILKQDSGTVSIDEQPIFENPVLKSRVVFIPDVVFFFSQYTVLQMAKFYQDVYPNWNQERFKALQTLLGLDVNKKVQRFSKGMQRQVAFWLSLCAMPDVLILDEPFDGLDPVIRNKVKNLIIQDVAERDMTVIVSSHNLREVEDICDYVGILHRGSFILEKDLDDLKSDVHKVQVAFKNEVPEALFASLNLLHQEQRGSVVLCIVKGKESEIEQVIKQYNPVIYDVLPLTLEEIFIYEMGGVGYAVENILV